MNEKSESRPINWRKFFWVAVVLLIAGYTYAHPALEKWTGMELPSLTSESDSSSGSESTTSDSEQPNGPVADQDLETNKAATSKTASSKFELEETGRNQFRSPAGLMYSMGPRGEHRIDHVLRHAKDNPERPVHSVFEGDRDEILALIDEAFELIKQRSKRVKSSREGNRVEYTVDLQKRIGFEGGEKGKRKGFPPLRRLKLILQNENYVVTAYPYR